MALDGSYFRLGTTQVVTVNTTSAAQTTAMQAGTNVVRLMPTVAMHVKIGKAPTATTNDAKVYAGIEYYYVTREGEKVAAVRTTTSGTLYVTEVS